GLASGHCGPDPVSLGSSPAAPMLGALAFGDPISNAINSGDQLLAILASSGFAPIDTSDPRTPRLEPPIPTAGPVVSVATDPATGTIYYVDATGVLAIPGGPSVQLPSGIGTVTGLERV